MALINKCTEKNNTSQNTTEEIPQPEPMVKSMTALRVDRLMNFFIHHIHRHKKFGHKFIFVEILALCNVLLQISIHNYLLNEMFANLGVNLFRSAMVNLSANIDMQKLFF
jgi:hypothetical protein